MGALHDGHLSLVNLGKQMADVTVVSIFINPTQFHDQQDYEKYPVKHENDIALLKKCGCDVIFIPAVQEIYPAGTDVASAFELGELESVLEGKHRPGHFQGVAQVVHRLLGIVQSDFLFLGRKDYQQCLVIKKLLDILESPVKVVLGDTCRESNGLAMSSRNLRLSEEEKDKSTAIYKALLYLKENHHSLPFHQLENEATAMILAGGFRKVDYVSIADAATLQPAQAGQKDGLIGLVAAFMGDVRLIDNMILAK